MVSDPAYNVTQCEMGRAAAQGGTFNTFYPPTFLGATYFNEGEVSEASYVMIGKMT